MVWWCINGQIWGLNGSDLCFDFTMKIGELFGLNVFFLGFFSKPSTKIPPSRKRDFSWNRILQSLAGIYQGVKLICMYIHIYCIYIQYIFLIYIFVCHYLYIYIQYWYIYLPRTQTTLALIGVLGLVLGLLTKNRGLIRYMKKLMKQWWTSGVFHLLPG